MSKSHWREGNFLVNSVDWVLSFVMGTKSFLSNENRISVNWVPQIFVC